MHVRCVDCGEFGAMQTAIIGYDDLPAVAYPEGWRVVRAGNRFAPVCGKCAKPSTEEPNDNVPPW